MPDIFRKYANRFRPPARKSFPRENSHKSDGAAATGKLFHFQEIWKLGFWAFRWGEPFHSSQFCILIMRNERAHANGSACQGQPGFCTSFQIPKTSKFSRAPSRNGAPRSTQLFHRTSGPESGAQLKKDHFRSARVPRDTRSLFGAKFVPRQSGTVEQPNMFQGIKSSFVGWLEQIRNARPARGTACCQSCDRKRN